MICGQTTREPLYWNVPLSYVPPWSRLCGRCALADKLWNCSVDRPLFMFTSWFGTRFSRLLQYAVLAAFIPRVSHFADTSAKLPSERTTPPSEPVMNCRGLPGTVTIACWSG